MKTDPSCYRADNVARWRLHRFQSLCDPTCRGGQRIRRSGDLSAFMTIVTDVQAIAATGDMAAAKTRIKDLETAWDDQAATLRALDGNAWGTIDDADAALAALRASAPDAAEVDTTLAALQVTLTTPSATAAAPVDAVLVAGTPSPTPTDAPCPARSC